MTHPNGHGVRLILCECGPIIKDLVDLDSVAAALGAHQAVASVERHATLCSDEGRAWLQAQLRENPFHRVVIAGCSPREHGTTFAGVLRAAGMNPYLLTMANIREQCGWVTPDKDQATAKATAIVRAAVARCLTQQPLEESEIECNSDALVVGAGVAGLTAARLLADGGRKVYLVERTPAVGGKTVLYGETFPNMECASCMLEPLMDEVLHHENIEVLTCSEVEELLGFVGNFTAKIRRTARHVDENNCFGCRACQEVCPVEIPDNEFDAGMSTHKAIYIPYAGALPNASVIDKSACLHFKDGSCDACVAACPFGNIDLAATDEVIERNVGAVIVATGSELKVTDSQDSIIHHPGVVTTYAFERILNTDGPTGGEIRLPDGKTPGSIALMYCSDESGSFPAAECSKTCCMSMAKYAREIRAKLPQASLLAVLWDRCAGGKGWREFALESAKDPSVTEIHLGPGGSVQVSPAAINGGVHLAFEQNGTTGETTVDMVVVATPQGGARGIESLAARLGVDTDKDGFILEEHARLHPFASRVEGIFVAGCAQAPKDVAESAAHGAAAAAGVLSALVPGRKLTLDAATAVVDEKLCGGCRLCSGACPYKAISFDEERHTAEVNELLCHGCGSCAAACPSSAISAKNFTDEQIFAETGSLCAKAQTGI